MRLLPTSVARLSESAIIFRAFTSGGDFLPDYRLRCGIGFSIGFGVHEVSFLVQFVFFLLTVDFLFIGLPVVYTFDMVSAVEGFGRCRGSEYTHVWHGSCQWCRFCWLLSRESFSHGIGVFRHECTHTCPFPCEHVCLVDLSFVHFGVPCATFSRARYPAIRSRRHLWGIPNVSETDKQILNISNKVTKNALILIDICLTYAVPITIENPHSSMLWQLPFFRRNLKSGRLQQTVLDFCQYGEPWRKRTLFASSGIPNMDKIGLRCTGKNRICSKTKVEHVILRGRHKSGKNMTKAAEPYPWELCRRLAYLVWQSFQVDLTNRSKFRHTARQMVPSLYLQKKGLAS